jgi:hypothetical protein
LDWLPLPPGFHYSREAIAQHAPLNVAHRPGSQPLYAKGRSEDVNILLTDKPTKTASRETALVASPHLIPQENPSTTSAAAAFRIDFKSTSSRPLELSALRLAYARIRKFGKF